MTFSNRGALFSWGFCLIWWLMLLAMSWVFVRDGAPDGYAPELLLLVMGFFWMGGLVLAVFACSQPCYRVKVFAGEGIQVVWRYPFKRVRCYITIDDISPPTVVTGTDSEGDPYFYARLKLGELMVNLAEGHDRHACELVCNQFRAALAAGSA